MFEFDSGVPRRTRTGFVVPPALAPAAAMLQEIASGGSSSGSSSVAAAGQRGNVAAPRPRSEEEERRRKGKMPAVEHQSMPPPPPVEEKLMGDAIRAHATASASPAFAPWKDVPFDYGAVSQRLRDVLQGLGVVAGAGPVCVYEKEMSKSDRYKEQNRLLISCKDNGSNNGGDTSKSGSKKRKKQEGSGDELGAAETFKKIFSDKEFPIVERQPEQKQEEEGMTTTKKKKTESGRVKEKLGLDLQVYDRDGEMYELKCRYLKSNLAYRIIGRHWTHFLVKNGLLLKKKKRKRSPEAEGGEGQSSSPSPEPDDGGEGGPPEPNVRSARLELWAFRSPKLTQGCTGHADGKLGLVLLHYFEGDGAEAERVDVGRGSEEEDVMEPAMPNAGEAAHEKMDVDVPDVVALAPVVVEDAVHAHADAVPVVEPAMPNVGAHKMAIDVPDVVPAVLAEDGAGEDAVHGPNEENEDAVPLSEEERMLEAAEGLLLFSQGPAIFTTTTQRSLGSVIIS